MKLNRAVPLAWLSACLATASVLCVSVVLATDVPPTAPEWEEVVSNPDIRIELNSESLNVIPQLDGFVIQSKFRINLFHEIDVEGKAKKGWYYINTMSTSCNTGEMHINESAVYSKDGEELISGKSLGKIPRSANPKSFVNIWTSTVCKQFIGKRPMKSM